MRHKDRIYDIFSSAIRQAVAEHGCKDATPQASCNDAILRIWREAERHGAYALIDRMLYRFGRYRLGECSSSELEQIHSMLTSSLVPSSRRMSYCAPPHDRMTPDSFQADSTDEPT